MPTGTWRGILISICVAAAALAVVAGFAAGRVFAAGGDPGLGAAVQGGAVIVAALAFWHGISLVNRHFRELERLRGAVVTLAGDPNAVLPRYEPGEGGAEVERLHGALADVAARRAEERAAPDDRLTAVLASIEEAMLVITDQGQVSLVNHYAKALLGAERVRCGTSVFAALEREGVIAAMAEAQAAGRPCDAVLRDVEGRALPAKVASLEAHSGAVLSFAHDLAEYHPELEHALELHDRPPAAGAFTEATPLAELAVVVMDTETTGLDPTRDRVLSIGAVRLHGGRMYRSAAFDRLVHPGVAIPPRSTAIHGITDEMVVDARGFAEVYAQLAPLIDGTILVGHNIPFDLAMLRRECRLAGMEWAEPPFLDTLRLAAALDGDLPDLNLEGLARHFGVDIHGRHTALGDSLVTAEIYLRMLPRLHDAGVRSLGEALEFSARARHIVARQKAAGW
jgi:DNA polymerase-3 subunit epsilon